MTQEKLDRINQLAKKARESGLSEEEKAEQQALRLEYVNSYKQNLISQLENTYIVDDKGNKRKVTKRQ